MRDPNPISKLDFFYSYQAQTCAEGKSCTIYVNGIAMFNWTFSKFPFPVIYNVFIKTIYTDLTLTIRYKTMYLNISFRICMFICICNISYLTLHSHEPMKLVCLLLFSHKKRKCMSDINKIPA